MHVCNDVGVFNAGFAKTLAARWPWAKQGYLDWYRGGKTRWAKEPLELGAVQFLAVDTDLWVANLIAQHGVGHSGPPIRYDALEKCLNRVARATLARKVLTVAPRLGCNLAGASWAKVEPLIQQAFGDQQVFVYDFPGGTFNP
jgi:hypothetical protein